MKKNCPIFFYVDSTLSTLLVKCFFKSKYFLPEEKIIKYSYKRKCIGLLTQVENKILFKLITTCLKISEL